MSQPDFYTMCATVFAPDGSFDESAMRLYLRRQIDARLGVYLGSGGNVSDGRSVLFHRCGTCKKVPNYRWRTFSTGTVPYRARFST